MNWKTFPEEKPNYGDIIAWRHYQAPSNLPEVIVFDRDTEWLDGDLWLKLNGTKRKPLSDGTLPLTESEKSELSEMMGYENISEIFYDNKLHFKCFDKGWGIITDVKAIAYLLERFELIKED